MENRSIELVEDRFLQMIDADEHFIQLQVCITDSGDKSGKCRARDFEKHIQRKNACTKDLRKELKAMQDSIFNSVFTYNQSNFILRVYADKVVKCDDKRKDERLSRLLCPSS